MLYFQHLTQESIVAMSTLMFKYLVTSAVLCSALLRMVCTKEIEYVALATYVHEHFFTY
jgi:hypothetical protein